MSLGAEVRKTLAFALIGASLLGSTTAQPAQAQAQDTAHGPPRMLALLIGNGDYNGDGAITLGPPPGNFLRDLQAPCEDIAVVQQALEMLAPPGEIEIRSHCNLTAAQIRQEVLNVAQHMSEIQSDYELDAPPVLLIYFAGHGIQLGPRNYLFGIGAQPELQRAARMHLERPNRTLLTREAVELNKDIVNPITGERFGSPIFIVIDACREDAVPIRPASWQGIVTAGLAPDTSRDFAIPGANGSAAQPGGDMLIAFSTSGGAKADDHSGYARAFAAVLPRRDLTATEAFVELRRQVLLNSGGRQMPSEIVGLMRHYCFAGCETAATSTPAAFQPPVSTLPRASQPPNYFHRIRWQDDQTRLEQPSMEVFFTPPEPTREWEAQREYTRFDIFYCAAADQGARYQRAREIAAEIRDLPGVSLRGRRAEVGTIRIRRLSERANERPGYRVTRDEVRFEALDQVETAWSERISALGRGVVPNRVANATPSYMSIFICGGPASAPPPT